MRAATLVLLALLVVPIAQGQTVLTGAQIRLEFEGQGGDPYPGETWDFAITVILVCMGVVNTLPVRDETTIAVRLHPHGNMTMEASADELVFPGWSCLETNETARPVDVAVTFPQDPPGTMYGWAIAFEDVTDSPTHSKARTVSIYGKDTTLQANSTEASAPAASRLERESPLPTLALLAPVAAAVIVHLRRGTKRP